MSRLLIVAAVLLIACSANGQITKQGNGYLFRLKFAKGQTLNYNVDATTATQSKLKVTTPIRQKITAVSPKQVATVEVKMGPMLVNGKPFSGPNGSTPTEMTYQIDRMGHVQGSGTQQQTSLVVPSKPVRIGQSWSADTEVPAAGMGPMSVSQTYKLLGFEKVGSRMAAKLQMDTKGKGKVNLSGSGLMWVDMADGSLLKTKNVLTVALNQSVLKIQMNLVRV